MRWIEFRTGLPAEPGQARERIAARYVHAARLVLLWERAWPALWPGLGVLGVYVTLALFGVFEGLAPTARILLMLAFLGAAGAFAWINLERVRKPLWLDGARRVERDSGLFNRPLTEGADRIGLGRGDPLAERLWRAHILRLLASARVLRLMPPRSAMGQKDPYYVRFAVLLAVVAAFVYAGREGPQRLSGAFFPSLGSANDTAVLNAWVSPPAYTGMPPRALGDATKRDAEGRIAVPEGSTLVLRLRGVANRPLIQLRPAPDNEDDEPEFAKAESGFTADVPIAADGRVTVALGARTFGDWRFTVVADQAPSIAFAEPPEASERYSVKFAYKASDDYGIAAARVRIVPLDTQDKEAPEAEPLFVDLPVPGGAKNAAETVFRDLTAEPYAGMKVAVSLIATDGAGQTGRSETVTFTLPERVFTEPLARALIELRKGLAFGGEAMRTRAETAVDALTIAPEKFYAEDFAPYLGLRVLKYKLVNLKTPEDRKATLSYMWDMALALEEGDLAGAAEALRRAQEQLMAALERGASEEEISALMDKLREAMSRYMRELAENAQPGQGEIPPGATVLGAQDLQDLLRAIEELARTGNTEDARQLLAGLMQLLENLRITQGQGGQGQQGDSQAAQTMRDLSDLMGDQRELLDRTFRAQRGQQGEQGQGQGQQRGQGQQGQGQQGQGQQGQRGQGQGQQGESPGGMAQDQEALRNRLGEIIGRMGQGAPQGLGEAGESMGLSSGNLRAEQYGSAAEAQQEALEQLRQGAQQMAQQMMGQQPGQGQPNGPDGPGMRRQGALDPLGRPMEGTGSMLGSMVKIPEQSDLQRAREILNELRKRSGERSRSQEELDYIERLLRLF